MALTAGERLGPYEILERIGAGGMGEVYLARDTRLGRNVAVKVSATQFTERFEREARAVAALNHPNICTLHDVGPNYLVMEYVEGAAPQGPMPLEEALRIARQITEALGEAHEKNIVHRDLKPGNIRVKPDGTVKVLDFGLAKHLQSGEPSSEHSPTLSMAATQAGAILGTAAYMAPEQARGKNVDRRADIWAFGVVFYEILTGRKLFQGEDVTETLASVVKERPDLTAVPSRVRRLLARCLEKDPKKRLRDIGDVWELLEEEKPAAEIPPMPAAPQSRLSWAVAGAFAALAALTGYGWWAATRPVEKPLVRLDVDLGADVSLPPVTTGGGTFAISPDGTRLAYTSGNPTKLYVRRLDQQKANELSGTSGASSPFFWPDSQWIGFFTANQLNKISVEGGAVVPLGEFPRNFGAQWLEDGTLIIGNSLNRGLVELRPGGKPADLTQLASGEIIEGFPQLLPGGKAVLFTAYTASLDPDRASIEVLTLADHRRKTVQRGGALARYLPSGHLIYQNKATLFAVPFDLDKLEARGTALPVLDDLGYNIALGVSGFSVSTTGTFVYRRNTGAGSGTMTIQWLDSTGKKSPLLGKPGIYADPALSPDGKRLALVITEGSGSDVWVYDIQRDSPAKLTSGGGPFARPVWTPDGRFVVFSSIGRGLYWTRADGASQPQPLTQAKEVQIPWSFSPEGKRLAIIDAPGVPQIATVAIDEPDGRLQAGKPEPFFQSQTQELFPSFSPDGKWIAYASNNSGRQEIEVRAFPPPASGQGGKWLVSNNGGQLPVWSKTSHDLFYLSGDTIMAASYTVQGDSFKVDKPRVWAEKTGATEFDLESNGKRAVILTPVATPEAPKQEHEVVLLENFFDELKRRVPLKK